MKKIPLFVLIICVQVLLLFFEVHKKSQIIKVKYQIQLLEQKIDKLTFHKRQIALELAQEQEEQRILSFTKNHQMKMITLPDIHTSAKAEEHAMA